MESQIDALSRIFNPIKLLAKTYICNKKNAGRKPGALDQSINHIRKLFLSFTQKLFYLFRRLIIKITQT